MSELIHFQNVSFSYPEQEDSHADPVLSDVSFSIEEGSFVAVLGHNGSGKSTLAKHINAILKPTQGTVTVDGMDTSDDDLLFDIRQTVGMVFQNPDNQLVATVVEEDVAFGPENLGLPAEEIRRRVDEALQEVGMYEYRNHAPHQLSGGQKQRIAIAGILAMHPKCIVLDEPTAMLDPSGRREVMNTVRELNQIHGTTVVFITHYMDEAAKADRILVINKGKLLLDGTPKQVFSKVEEIKAVGLDVPQVTELAYLLEQDGCSVPADILTIEECVSAMEKLLEDSSCQS